MGNKRKRENQMQSQSGTIKEEKKIINQKNNQNFFITNNITNKDEKIGISSKEDLSKSELNIDLVENHDTCKSSTNSQPQLSVFEVSIIIWL